MDEILLTPEEMDAALIEGGKKYRALIEAVNEQRKAGEKAVYPNDYHVKAEVICRAQVRKVVEWMEARVMQRLHANADFSNDEPIRVSMRGSDWQALREAAGEGK